MSRQDLIDEQRKWSQLLPREEANMRRLQRRYAAQVMADVLADKNPARRTMLPQAIRDAAQTVKETRDCLACVTVCLIGTETRRPPHVHAGYRYMGSCYGMQVPDYSRPIQWLCINPHCDA